MERLQNIGTMPIPPSDQHPAREPAEPREIGQQPSKTAPPPAEKTQDKVVAPPTRQQVEEFAEQLQDALADARPADWHVGIREDANSGDIVIEIKDAAGEVVKQFPPEIVLNLHRKLDDLAGVVVDETT